MDQPSKLNEESLTDASREEIMSAIFADMVIQLGNTALIFLGQIPNPETEEKMFEIEAAKALIDQLEMLDAKTKGNLSKDEHQLLAQTLSTVRIAFVEAINSQVSEDFLPVPKPSGTLSADESSGKKFSKKY